MQEVVAIVAARGGSVRLPRKALLPFGESTLIGHKIEQLKKCPRIARVYVNTDDLAIAAEAAGHGAILLEGKDYQGDARAMLGDSASQVEGDTVLWAHPTNPLVKSATYEAAIATFENRRPSHDSLVSVLEMRRHAWWHSGPFDLALNHRPWTGMHQVGADLEPVKFQDGAIFIQGRMAMMCLKRFYGRTPYLFAMNPIESTDIDTEADYVTASALFEHCHEYP